MGSVLGATSIKSMMESNQKGMNTIRGYLIDPNSAPEFVDSIISKHPEYYNDNTDIDKIICERIQNLSPVERALYGIKDVDFVKE